ncbi:hypothetical protein [Helcococcus ovis]|uniref:hypothetical protein n=3 Tax=Helcococcus ovis TaxID=72026 RepID=UPI00106FA9CC|nr:hypothetical protein [Helcococcus ovis]WNZ01782.1 hypothetical protein EQF90_002780 [Helcococcus ovis]
MKENKKLNSISVFLYSFALVLFEILLLDLAVTPIPINLYEMRVTVGILLIFLMISGITVLYMSDKFKKLKEKIFDNKINKIALVVGVLALVIVFMTKLNYYLFSLSIFIVILLIFLMFILGWIIEKYYKN